MMRRKVNMENMNEYAVGIDIGEKESVADLPPLISDSNSVF